jgi:hypothetical protein
MAIFLSFQKTAVPPSDILLRKTAFSAYIIQGINAKVNHRVGKIKDDAGVDNALYRR